MLQPGIEMDFLFDLQGQTNSRHLWVVFMTFKRLDYQNYWIARGCGEMEACSANPFFSRAKHFQSPELVVQAHWLLAPKPVAGAQPHPVMVKFHYYYTRECIFSLAVPSQLQWGEKFNFPNLRETETVRKQHREFEMWRSWFGFLFPAHFLINVKGEPFWEMYCLFKKGIKEHHRVASANDRVTQIHPVKGLSFN